MPLQMQIPNVLDQQCNQRVALLSGPTLSRAGFTDGAFHDVAAGRTATRDRAAKALGPGVVETQQLHELDELVGLEHLTVRLVEDRRHRGMGVARPFAWRRT